MNTVLMCGACGERCGIAWLDSNGHVVLDAGRVHSHERPPSLSSWRDNRADVVKLVSDLDRADHWPVTWQCIHCQKYVQLDRDRARRVGRAKRLIADSMPIEN